MEVDVRGRESWAEEGGSAGIGGGLEGGGGMRSVTVAADGRSAVLGYGVATGGRGEVERGGLVVVAIGVGSGPTGTAEGTRGAPWRSWKMSCGAVEKNSSSLG